MRHTQRAASAAVVLMSLALMLLPLRATFASFVPYSALSTPHSGLGRQSSAVTMGVSAGYGDTGAYIIGEWVPVRVTLANPPGGQNRRVRVEVDSLGDAASDVRGTFSQEVDLPSQSRKVATLFAYTGGYLRELRVRLFDGGSATAAATAKIEPLEGRENVIVAVVSSDPSLLNALGGESVGHSEDPIDPGATYGTFPLPAGGKRAKIAHIAMGDLPELPQALSSLGVLVLDDADTGSLTTGQRRALEGWVASGGMLVGLGRSTGGGSLAGVADLLPVTLGPSRAAGSLNSLGDLVAQPITPTGAVLIPSAALKTGPDIQARTLASDGGIPLAAVRELGGGHVVYLALSPSGPPLNTWTGTIPLVKRLLIDHPVRVSPNMSRLTGTLQAGGYGGFGQYFYGGGMFDIPGLDLPAPLLIAGFLFIYILLVGPVNFFILRRLRKQELAWLTVPALVLVFSVGSYLIGYSAKGGDSIVLRADLLMTAPGTSAGSAVQYLGLFSPSRGTYNVEAPPGSVVSEIGTYGYSERPENPILVSAASGVGATRVEDVTVNTWSLRGFMAESAAEEASPLELELRLGDDRVEGQARNRSGAPLTDVALLMAGQVLHLGTIGPGEARPVSLPVSSGASSQSVVTNLLPPPPGVQSNPYGGIYSVDGRSATDETRLYSRKIQVLNAAHSRLSPFTPPTRMEVLAFSWSDRAALPFRVQGSSREEALTLWAQRAYVRGEAEGASLSPGLVPFSTYAPGSSAEWIAGKWPGSTIYLSLSPRADVTLRLPAGTRPRSLRGTYRIFSLSGKVSVLAFNPATGEWTPMAELTENSSTGDSHFDVYDPAIYTGPAGDITLRFHSDPPSQTVNFETLAFSLNDDQAAR